MSTRIPITVDGNLTADPETGVSEKGMDWTRLRVAVNDRRLNEETQQWEDGRVVFHDVVAFGAQAGNVAASLRKGDAVLAVGEMQISTYMDKNNQEREDRKVIASVVGAPLRYNTVQIDRSPKGPAPEVQATGPVATPTTDSGAFVAR